MAEDRPGGEPTEEPTPRRLEKAKKEGQVARSRDLSAAVVHWAVVGALFGSVGWLAGQLVGVARTIFAVAGRTPDVHQATAYLGWAVAQGLSLAAAPLAAAVLAGVVAGAAQARGVLTLSPLKPKLERLNPLKNLKQVLGKQALFNLAKNLALFLLAGSLAYVLARQSAGPVLRLVGAPAHVVAATMWLLAKKVLAVMGGLFVAAGLADYAFAYRRHRKSLMMTKYEVQREMKEQEGDPQHKAKRQEFHQEILQSAMIQAVSQADVVVVNPTRIAVALRYKEGQDSAPVVVAKGRNVVARKIREAARRAGVPIYRDVPLARALFELELDQEIPEELYEAVAALLRLVQQEYGD